MDLARPTKLGVAFDSARVPRWQLDLFGGLLLSELCEVYVSVVPEARDGSAPGGLFGFYERWDQRHFERDDDALAPVDLQLDEHPAAPDDLDALIWLPDGALPREQAQRLPLGIWYLAQNGARTRADMPLAEEIRSGSGAVHTELRCYDGRDHRLLLGSNGVADRMSLHRARSRAYARAARLPLRHLQRLAQGEHDADHATLAAPLPRSRAMRGGRVPVRLAARVAARKLSALLLRDQWFVAYRRTGATGFETLVPPPGLNYADPFPVQVDGRGFLLFETFAQTGDGKIAAASIDQGSRPEPETVLDSGSHLSYPFLLRHGGDVLMMPESRRLRRVELWRAGNFPRDWTPERTLLEHLPATDATLFEWQGRMWLFTAIAVDDGPAVDELHLFSADSLDGEWKPHPRNPVVADVHRARPAGALFEQNGQLVRPAQDCSRAYGWRVVLNRVETLNESDYREQPYATLTPRGLGLTQLHTYNVGSDWEAIDVLRRTPRGRLGRAAPRSVRMSQDPYVEARVRPGS